jgi:hypothetical protein
LPFPLVLKVKSRYFVKGVALSPFHCPIKSFALGETSSVFLVGETFDLAGVTGSTFLALGSFLGWTGTRRLGFTSVLSSDRLFFTALFFYSHLEFQQFEILPFL